MTDREGHDGGDAKDDAGASADEGGAGAVHPATYASNWRTVLIVDASMGAAVIVAGVVAAVLWNLIVGALLGVAGAAYVVAVARRGRRWAERRARAGL